MTPGSAVRLASVADTLLTLPTTRPGDFNLICNITTYRKKTDLLTQPQGSMVCLMTEFVLAFCSMPLSL